MPNSGALLVLSKGAAAKVLCIPSSEYTVRVVYAGDNRRVKIRLVADKGLEVHPFIAKEFPPTPVAFDIPKAATANGTLTLTWTPEPGSGGAGRGCQVAEVWLTKKRE